MDIGRAADVQKREGKIDGVDMAQGHNIQAHIMFVEIEINGIMQIIGNVGLMGANHALGLSGGSRSVDQYPGVPGDNCCIGFGIR